MSLALGNPRILIRGSTGVSYGLFITIHIDLFCCLSIIFPLWEGQFHNELNDKSVVHDQL